MLNGKNTVRKVDVLPSLCRRGTWTRIKDHGSRISILIAAALLTACAAPRHPVSVGMQTSARPELPLPANAAPSGAIFQTAGFRPLFEDRKPRYVGDLLTIQINEKLDASQKANSSTERTSDAEVALPGISGLFGRKLNGLNSKASSSNAFDGKGETASSNLFTGAITVTVIEVLANGNLRIAGEKQIGIRQNSEVLRFSGVIDPALIQPGNIVSSTQVADARLDYRGGGYIEEAQIQGWLSRFFNSWIPF
jgi:flagellar L-ring protein precursor FlgH